MSFTKRAKACPNAAAAAAAHPTPPSRSAETIGNNDDLLDEILLRLPIKSLIRFKSVSKHWLSLISDPNFSLRRKANTPTTASGLFLTRSSRSVNGVSKFDFVNLHNLTSSSSKSPVRSLAFADGGHYGTRVVQACNGLLLCSSNRARDPRENFIFNPTTKQFTKLPPISPVGDCPYQEVFGLTLAFDPSRSPHYKVVCVRSYDIGGDEYQIEIYSSETRCWRLTGGSFILDSEDIRFEGGVYWNGSIHWISVWEASAYFNIEEERVSPLPMPPIPEDGLNHDREFTYFGESRGHLHLIDHIYDLQTPRFDVLEMATDYSGWLVKFRVDLSDIPSAFPQIVRTKVLNWLKVHDYVFSVLCVVRSEVDEESYLVLQIPGKVIRYNLKTKTFFKLCNFELDSRNKTAVDPNSLLMMFPELVEWSDAHQFIESLAVV